MNEELLLILTKIFPTFDPYTVERVKKSIIETAKSSDCDVYLEQPTQQNILQGDIFKNIEFITYNVDGKPIKLKGDIMVISNTCDISRNENILFIPFIPLEKLTRKINENDLKKNVIYNFFYIKEIENKILDFDRIIHLPRKQLEKIKENRKFSLTQYGFYMLLIKLSVYLMRIESEEVKRN